MNCKVHLEDLKKKIGKKSDLTPYFMNSYGQNFLRYDNLKYKIIIAKKTTLYEFLC